MKCTSDFRKKPCRYSNIVYVRSLIGTFDWLAPTAEVNSTLNHGQQIKIDDNNYNCYDNNGFFFFSPNLFICPARACSCRSRIWCTITSYVYMTTAALPLVTYCRYAGNTEYKRNAGGWRAFVWRRWNDERQRAGARLKPWKPYCTRAERRTRRRTIYTL